MVSIEVWDISDGWLVKFYSGDSTRSDSYTAHFENLEKAMKAIQKWANEHNLFAYFSE